MAESTSRRERVRVLVLSDVRDHRLVVRLALTQMPALDLHLIECTDLQCGIDVLESTDIDLIVIDTDTPAMQQLCRRHPQARVVYLDPVNPPQPRTGASDTDWAVAAAIPLARVYDDPDLLAELLDPVLRIHVAERRTERLTEALHQREVQVVTLAQRLYRQVPVDERTGLLTHAQITARLEEELLRSIRYSVPLAVAVTTFPDLAAMRRENAETCDLLLRRVAERIRQLIRQTDIIGHFGPTRFCSVLTNTVGVGGTQFCRRFNERFQDPLVIQGRMYQLATHHAVCETTIAQPEDLESLLALLDERLALALQGEPGTIVGEALEEAANGLA